MRVADQIINFVHDELGVDVIFTVCGGGVMFLTDSIGQHPNVKYVGCHHEQAAAMAASGYSRYTGKMGVCVVTTGCGGTNTLTGVLGAYQDRIPMFIISGQVKRSECTEYIIQTKNSWPKISFKQLGVQEVNIIPIVRPITVWSKLATDAVDVLAELRSLKQMAEYYNGPVWYDVPIDIQGAEIDE